MSDVAISPSPVSAYVREDAPVDAATRRKKLRARQRKVNAYAAKDLTVNRGAAVHHSVLHILV